MNPEPIILASAVEANYWPGFRAMMWSLARSQRPGIPIHLYLLDGGIVSADVDVLLCELTDAGMALRITLLPVDQKRFSGIKLGPGANQMTYARLLLPELLESEDRVIYIDADIVIERPLNLVWELDLGDKTLAAVPDFFAKSLFRDAIAAVLPAARKNDLYFNGGFLLLDLARLRKERFTDRSLAFLSANSEKCDFWDQSTLNALLGPSVHWLGLEWNLPAWAAERFGFGDHSLINIHFMGAQKPWNAGPGYPQLERFRRHAEGSLVNGSREHDCKKMLRGRVELWTRYGFIAAMATLGMRHGDRRFALAMLRLDRLFRAKQSENSDIDADA